MHNRPTPKVGEVWYVDFDPQRGREQAGRRPALVISNDRFNETPNGLILVVPVTGTDRGIPAHVRVESGVGGLTKTSFVMCDQAGPKSGLRFLGKMGEMPAEMVLTVRRMAGRFIDAHLIYR